MRTKRWLALCMMLAACEGPMGPAGEQGPVGPPGPQGAQGPGVTVAQARGTMPATGIIAHSFGGFSLSRASVQCWISDDGVQWIKVAFDTDSQIACGAREQNGVLVVSLLAPPFWEYLIVVTEPN